MPWWAWVPVILGVGYLAVVFGPIAWEAWKDPILPFLRALRQAWRNR